MPRLTTTEYAVLGLLAFGDRSGYDLARAAERSIGYMWAPSRSQIYKVLPRLVALGCATRRDVEQRSRPDKALYRVTPVGRATLRTWIEEVEPEAGGDGEIFLLKLFLGWIAAPEASLNQLAAYRAMLERRLAEFEGIRDGLPPDEPPHSRLALEHGIARVQATLAWADEAPSTLGIAARAGQA